MLFSSYHTMLLIYAYTYGKSFLLFHFVMDQYQVRCLGAFAVVLDGFWMQGCCDPSHLSPQSINYEHGWVRLDGSGWCWRGYEVHTGRLETPLGYS